MRVKGDHDEPTKGRTVRPPNERVPLPTSPERETEEWVLVEEIVDEAGAAVGRGRRGAAPREAARGRTPASEPPVEVHIDRETKEALSKAVGPRRATRAETQLRDATRAFAAERFADAAPVLKRLADEAPGVASVRELYGLTLYRQGKWAAAIKQLEAFRALTGSTEQNPVLADCYRAKGKYAEVEALWRELREASPDAAIVTEGRIVAAGALADQGRVDDARRLLEQGFRFPARPKEHHLRRAYALADMVERTGDVVGARDRFERIARAAPDFADARRRARALA